MHLRLSEDEFATLIDMVSLAAEISSLNQRPGSEDHFGRFEDLEDKILAKAKEQGFGDIVEIDKERNKHRVTVDYQAASYIQECIEEMRNEVFWEELSLRLAERDLVKEIGEYTYQNLSDEERVNRLTPGQTRYWEQFSKTGVMNVHLVSPRGTG
ncbi:MAG: hypothetical protein Q7Q71_00390 [Verrucomicrobiota bacterium JB023]|nr:hypothetical protein [Verrucomicrobiota bacterium JB023]